MGLLTSLGLPTRVIPVAPTKTAPVMPTPPDAPKTPLVQTTVSIFNGSAGELTLVKSALQFGTAKFEPAAPAKVPGKGKVSFRVVEPTAGAKQTAGMLQFAYPGKGGKVDVTCSWAGKKADIKVAGDGTFTRQTQAVEDLDRGNEYRMMFKEGEADDAEMLPPLADPDAPEQPPGAGGGGQEAQPIAQPTPQDNKPDKVTIVNESGFDLTLAATNLEQKATFKSSPPKTVDGGRTGRFEVLCGEPDWTATAGTVTYTFTTENADDPNGPGVAQTLTLEWSGQLWGSRLNPGRAGLDSKPGGSIGDYLFRLIGPTLEFAPPAEAKEPTLRRGDKSADGWVEYLQASLNHHIGAGLEVDGDFGGQTLKAVLAFQRKFKKEGVLVDGIVGDQTWSYLREGAPAKPKTDGRKPHSYVEKGAEARWSSEKNNLIYDYGGDNLVMIAVSVGDVALVESRRVRIRVVNPAGVQKVVDRPVGRGVESSKGEQRDHVIAIAQFSTLFDATHTGSAALGDYAVTAYFPADLGGDTYTGVLHIGF